MIKVMHLVYSNSYSGAENVICQIMKMFECEENIKMIYCGPDGKISETLKSKNLPFFALKNFTWSSVSKAIKEWKPDIIHAHDRRATVMAALCYPFIPVISHVHGANYDKKKLTLSVITYFLSTLRTKHIFWVSDSSLDKFFFKSLVLFKSTVLYNVINKDKLYTLAEEDHNIYDFDIVYLGRLVDLKDPYRLLNIIQKIISKKSDIKIAIIGDGPMKTGILQKIQKMNLENNITVTGFLSNPYKILKEAKCLIMSSKYEGTPMCVLESLCLGTPVVSTPTDGVKFVVQHGVSGYLSSDDDNLAEYCYQICTDNILSKKLSKNALNRADELMDISHYKKVLEDVYLRYKK